MLKIIENPPIDSSSSSSYWIEETYKTFFGLIKRRKIIGAYTISEEFGYLGDMPFFSKTAAALRLRNLSKTKNKTVKK